MNEAKLFIPLECERRDSSPCNLSQNQQVLAKTPRALRHGRALLGSSGHPISHPKTARLFPAPSHRLKSDGLDMVFILITLLSAMSSQQRILRIVERRPVTQYLLELTGPKFTDCGGYALGFPEDWEQNKKAVLDCAMKAVTQDTRFIFKVSYLNADSAGVEGSVRTSVRCSIYHFNCRSAFPRCDRSRTRDKSVSALPALVRAVYRGH